MSSEYANIVERFWNNNGIKTRRVKTFLGMDLQAYSKIAHKWISLGIIR